MLLQGREALAVREDDILDEAATEMARALERSGLQHLASEPADYWGVNRRGGEGHSVRG